MNLPFILDVAIGLIFIFLILSLLASELQELLTTLLQWRAKHLKESIEVLLAGGSGTEQEEKIRNIVNKLYDDPLIKNINQEAKGLAGWIRGITRWLIPINQKGNFFGGNRSSGPSYIAPETFATSLLERLGLGALARKLVEVRLKNFVTRIVGLYDVQEGAKRETVPLEDTDQRLERVWNKGRIRLIGEQTGKLNLDKDPDFKLLVEEFDDILNDFNAGESNLTTAVERMGESLSTYIANYPGSTTDDKKDASTDTQPDDAAIDQKQDLIRFGKRLIAFKRGVFGEKSERAVASGGLRPSLLEMAELINQSSATHREVAAAYQRIVADGETLHTELLPYLKQQLLDTQLEGMADQLACDYPQAFKVNLEKIAPEIVTSFQRQLKDASQQPQVLSKIFDHLDPSQKTGLKTGLIKNLLEELEALPKGNSDSQNENEYNESVFIDRVLDRLTHEDRQIAIDQALTAFFQANGADDNEERKQRSLYHNYLTYITTQQVLAALPNSVKESFAILARRAQVRVGQSSHDINQFRQEVEVWFDRSMSRASGVYKRNAKGVAILIGLLLAVVTNVDTLFIVERLSNNADLRNVVTSQAIEASKTQNLDKLRADTNEALEELALPIGWQPDNIADQLNCDPTQAGGNQSNQKPDLPSDKTTEAETKAETKWDLPSTWPDFYSVCLGSNGVAQSGYETIPEKLATLSPILRHHVTQSNPRTHSAANHADNQTDPTPENPLKTAIASLGNLLRNVFLSVVKYPLAIIRILFGWLIAGIAISMGAPFWFDLLGKIVNVRNSGSKPASVENQSVAKPVQPEPPTK